MTLKQKTCDEIKQIIYDKDHKGVNLSHITGRTIKEKIEFNSFYNMLSRIKIF